MNMYRLRVIIDDVDHHGVLLEIPLDNVHIDQFAEVMSALGPHKIVFELKRIT